MKMPFLLISLLLLVPNAVMGDAPSKVAAPKVIRDPTTKVVYYMESDRHHISAIGPDGKLLWCCQVLPPSKAAYILDFSFSSPDDYLPEGSLRVTVRREGSAFAFAMGSINKKTGTVSELFKSED